MSGWLNTFIPCLFWGASIVSLATAVTQWQSRHKYRAVAFILLALLLGAIGRAMLI